MCISLTLTWDCNVHTAYLSMQCFYQYCNEHPCTLTNSRGYDNSFSNAKIYTNKPTASKINFSFFTVIQ
jgi:hypothetical protein